MFLDNNFIPSCIDVAHPPELNLTLRFRKVLNIRYNWQWNSVTAPHVFLINRVWILAEPAATNVYLFIQKPLQIYFFRMKIALFLTFIFNRETGNRLYKIRSCHMVFIEIYRAPWENEESTYEEIANCCFDARISRGHGQQKLARKLKNRCSRCAAIWFTGRTPGCLWRLKCEERGSISVFLSLPHVRV